MSTCLLATEIDGLIHNPFTVVLNENDSIASFLLEKFRPRQKKKNSRNVIEHLETRITFRCVTSYSNTFVFFFLFSSIPSVCTESVHVRWTKAAGIGYWLAFRSGCTFLGSCVNTQRGREKKAKSRANWEIS